MAPTDPSTPANYSLFSIPAYLLITMLPHIYSANLLTTTPPATKDKPAQSPRNIYNMGNPRSASNKDRYAAALDKTTFGRWERARAAHAHLFENAPFFISAVLAGIVTRLSATYMNYMMGLYLMSRLAYVFAYVAWGKGALMFGRTVLYFFGKGVLLAVWWEAGKRVMSGEY